MADDKPTAVEVASAVDEEALPESKNASARKKSLGGLDSSSVLSGPRQRKKAEHYQVEVKEKAEFVIKPGKGAKLGDIPNVHFLLGKLKTDDELLTSLHTLLFRRPGTAHRRKKNLYEFSGLTFDDGDKEKEIEKIQERLGKWTKPLLNGALDVFELPRGNGDEGKKEAKVERLLKFLEEPKKLSEKDLAAQAAKKKDAAKAKKEKEQKSKTPKSAAKGGRKSEGGQESTKKKRGKKAESEEEAAEEPSDDEQADEPEEEAEPEPVQPKKRAKKEEPASAKEKKTPPSTKTAGKKRKASEVDAAERVPAEGADEAAPSATSPDLPDDDAIKEATLALLKVADVNKTTVKDLLQELKEKFGKDLSKKKSLIKKVAVGYAQSHAAASEEAEDTKQDATAADDVRPPAKKQKTGDDGDEAEATDEAKEDAVMENAKAEPSLNPAEAEPGPTEFKVDGDSKTGHSEPDLKEPATKEAEADAKEPAAKKTDGEATAQEPVVDEAPAPADDADKEDSKDKSLADGQVEGETVETGDKETKE